MLLWCRFKFVMLNGVRSVRSRWWWVLIYLLFIFLIGMVCFYFLELGLVCS